jgi:cell division protein FtsQ
VSTPVRGRGSRPARGPAADRARARRPARRPKRRRVDPVILRRRAVAVLSLLTVVGLFCCVWFTPMIGVRSVDVSGVEELSADEVREVAAIERGTPLVRLDVEGIAARVRELPRVSSVEVQRSFPGSVLLQVTERTPVGYVKAADGAHLVDVTGKDYAVLAEAPAGMPELVLENPGQDDPATIAVVGVLTGLPEQLRPEVISATAKTGGDVRLTLALGREVRWGDLTETPRKGAVLMVLLTREGKVFDVSSPQLPTVS